MTSAILRENLSLQLFNMFKNPITQKRFIRFKQMKRAYYSFWALILLYSLSLFSECICNNIPLYVHYDGQSFLPLIWYYPDDQFTGSGKHTRPNYKKILNSEAFKKDPDNWMLFPLHPYGPNESISPESIEIDNQVHLIFHAQPSIGYIHITKDLKIQRASKMKSFTSIKDQALKGQSLAQEFVLPQTLITAIEKRFHNESASREIVQLTSKNGSAFSVSLSTYRKRSQPPRKIRLIFRQSSEIKKDIRIVFESQKKIIKGQNYWTGTKISGQKFQLTETQKERLTNSVETRFQRFVEPVGMKINQVLYKVKFEKEDLRFPFRPVKGHPLGLDSAGRDVLSRILHGLRISMTFGMILVIGSMTLGILLGAIQGYYGGLLDLIGQRLTEIWSALPFLYIMILMGAVLGRSFILLLICYGMFNWIGISYYIRAEFLRLRRQAFVEAAQCLGLPTWKILFYHILPNALTPIITFAPFSLVGAIGSLAALDYLGFGLPPPTPSWGEMLAQAQAFRWAWWLILYPSLALFVVMLLGVFVGEGVRNAYDPKPYSRMQ
ncbi:Binding-protein-dependent transport system inner membrane component [Candidatus Magnetomorum sp. HK-1]|nr:Binding-protein-dependent transport system inner membrane component [Candidatus Magnetomorum sp. HK-1]